MVELYQKSVLALNAIGWRRAAARLAGGVALETLVEGVHVVESRRANLHTESIESADEVDWTRLAAVPPVSATREAFDVARVAEVRGIVVVLGLSAVSLAKSVGLPGKVRVAREAVGFGRTQAGFAEPIAILTEVSR